MCERVSVRGDEGGCEGWRNSVPAAGGELARSCLREPSCCVV